MKYFGLFLFIFLPISGNGQTSTNLLETYPLFSNCVEAGFQEEKECFEVTLRAFILENFVLPHKVVEEDYRGEMMILFEVDKSGKFNILYVDAVYSELKREIHRVFDKLPLVQAPTYNGKTTYAQFRMPIRIPLDKNIVKRKDNLHFNETSVVNIDTIRPAKPGILEEYDSVKSTAFRAREMQSNLNIPLSHERYSRFDAEMNQIGTNTHTASKPYLYRDVARYHDFDRENALMQKDSRSWLGRKLWNDHLVQFQGDNYWFSGDLVLDLQLGRDFQSEFNFTYNNTRGAVFQGGLGRNFNFYTVVFESQARFADYYNLFAESISPFMGSGVAIVPGRGIAKDFMDNGYDYPVAEGYLSYSPTEFFDIQFGHGNNFIGDGYRSLLMSDNASPHPYLKLNTIFWKLKYTNTWMSLRDVREEVAAEGSYRTKYMATHYLSLNLTKRFNLGLFESVVWQNDNGRGFDVNYLNPVIFYRSIEFSTGARGGNAIMGLTGKYKVNNSVNAYGQWIIDEFSSGDVFGGKGSWKNKLGFQLGMKYFNAFNVPDLFLQAEFNQVRPYTYSHNSIVLNYGHNNQSMAHLWGANFREFVGIARYRKDRWLGSAKLVLGERGFDFNFLEDKDYYGGDIYRSERDRAFETGVKIGQGNKTTSIFTELEVGYIVNPVTNLKMFASAIFRNFDPQQNTEATFNQNTVWLNIGLRTDIFNWYFDY